MNYDKLDKLTHKSEELFTKLGPIAKSFVLELSLDYKGYRYIPVINLEEYCKIIRYLTDIRITEYEGELKYLKVLFTDEAKETIENVEEIHVDRFLTEHNIEQVLKELK